MIALALGLGLVVSVLVVVVTVRRRLLADFHSASREGRRCPSSASPEHVCTGYSVGVLRGPRDCEGRPL